MSIGSMLEGNISVCIKEKCMFWGSDYKPADCLITINLNYLSHYIYSNTNLGNSEDVKEQGEASYV